MNGKSEEACLSAFRKRLPSIATSTLLSCLKDRELDQVVFGPMYYPALRGGTWGPTGDLPKDREPYYLSSEAYREVCRVAILAITAEINIRMPPRHKEGNEAREFTANDWTVVEYEAEHGDLCDVVRRLPVPGGWLYQVGNKGLDGNRWSSPVFVPVLAR